MNHYSTVSSKLSTVNALLLCTAKVSCSSPGGDEMEEWASVGIIPRVGFCLAWPGRVHRGDPRGLISHRPGWRHIVLSGE